MFSGKYSFDTDTGAYSISFTGPPSHQKIGTLYVSFESEQTGSITVTITKNEKLFNVLYEEIADLTYFTWSPQAIWLSNGDTLSIALDGTDDARCELYLEE
jgi:hypothetical protein